MKTFNGDENLKQSLIADLQHHQELDAFVKGTWIAKHLGKIKGNGFRGCFYGCTMQTEIDPLSKFSQKFNIDPWFCHLTERIFEGLPDGEYQTFPLESISKLPVGADLNDIKSKWFKILLTDQLRFVDNGSRQEASIKQCILLFDTPFSEITKSAAESAAWSAAWSAAKSAKSAAKSAAWSAAKSAKSAAESAESAAKSAWSAAKSAESAAESAWSAAWSAESAESAAESSHYVWMKDQLFVLLDELNQQLQTTSR